MGLGLLTNLGTILAESIIIIREGMFSFLKNGGIVVIKALDTMSYMIIIHLV